jgi:hypothetical protein
MVASGTLAAVVFRIEVLYDVGSDREVEALVIAYFRTHCTQMWEADLE